MPYKYISMLYKYIVENKYIVERVIIYLGLGISASILFISLLYIGVYFVEERISNMPEIDQMAENSKKINSEIQRYREILEKSGIQDSDIMEIQSLDDNLNKSLTSIDSLMHMLASYETTLSRNTDSVNSMTSDISDTYKSISARQEQMEIAYGNLEKSINKIISLESENSKLNATVAHHRNLLQQILALSEDGKGLGLSDDMKQQIANAADGKPQIQIGGPED